MVGTGIESIRRRQEREQSQNAGRPRDAKKVQSGQIVYENLTIIVGGTHFAVFIPGVHNPDDLTVTRYVP